MPMRPAASPNADDLEEARFRSRMARASSGGAIRPQRREQETEEDGRRRFRLGWFAWLLIDAFVVLGTVAIVVAWPPVEACRAQEKTVGFYAGDSVGRCIRRGIGQRISNADQRIKMILRGSGR
ncbi:hypothetical protein [Methylobacterium sp. J-076]|uniref:hypothetical protein n=1 Tax=Methylobacterium sp. J-076 TaxID=2836655 RepID=UPI001FB9B73E|nr:hypothetical protein [Methylobacterium sp. J-076]MCJ2012850.1 hypothetical protein [Methylobacterium sp. J-076]